jgi:hypothetical protein
MIVSIGDINVQAKFLGFLKKIAEEAAEAENLQTYS